MAKRKAVSDPPSDDPSTSQSSQLSDVIYVGHLPHGFYEDQLKGFFSQFGTVTGIKVSRNKKTAKAKHYAFVRFSSPEVAAIAAEAMNGYLMFTQKLVVHVMKASHVHKDLFKGANRKFKAIPWQKLEEKRHNKDRSPEEQARRLTRAVSRDRKRQKLIQAAGVEYTYPVLSSQPKLQGKAVKDDKATKSARTKKAASSNESKKAVMKVEEAVAVTSEKPEKVKKASVDKVSSEKVRKTKKASV